MNLSDSAVMRSKEQQTNKPKNITEHFLNSPFTNQFSNVHIVEIFTAYICSCVGKKKTNYVFNHFVMNITITIIWRVLDLTLHCRPT